jgi:hypothetical protein
MNLRSKRELKMYLFNIEGVGLSILELASLERGSR